MARPTKAVSTRAGHLTKEELNGRLEQEKKLKGNANNIFPSKYLSKTQKKIFKYIVDELRASGILGNLDIFILDTCSIAIDRLRYIETMINNNPDLILDKQLMASKEKYTKDLYRCCNELSLSPQSRGKLGNISLEAKKKDEDPLLQALAGDGD